MTWDTPVTLNQVVLYDNPAPKARVMSSLITFSDGTFVVVPALNNDGSATYINLPDMKTTTSVTWEVLSIASSSPNMGIAEISVFAADPRTFTTPVVRYA